MRRVGDNTSMHITSARMARLLTLGALVLFVGAACTSAAGAAGWTYAPPVNTGPPAASGSSGASGSPAASGSSGATMNPSMSMSAAPSGSTAGNVIQLTETADLRITDASGNTVSSIPVQKGQTYTFQITNTAGFAHDFYIGTPDDLKAANTSNLKGLDQFLSGTQSFTYTFDSAGPLGFGCTLPGHYQSMNGLFVIQ
jgi:uncharacterized cupredoxin-like copper-binding protein